MPPHLQQLVFQGTHSSAILVFHLVAVVLALLLVVLLSGYERQLISKSLGYKLMLLRIAALAVILLMLMQPTLQSTLEQKQTGRILVGIDLSDSMATTDEQASLAEKLRVVRGLEFIGTAATEERLNQWQKAFETQQEPEWVDADESKADESQQGGLAQSRKELLQSLFGEIDQLRRSEIARRLLVATKDPLLDRLSQSHRVDLFVFAGKWTAIDRESLANTIKSPPVSLSTGMTDLAMGLQPASNSEGNVVGTILLTDGRDQANQNLSQIAASLKMTNSPVYPVLIGSSYRPRDLSILLVEHPHSVYKGDHPQLKVAVGTAGFEGKTIDVELISDENPDATPIRKSVLCSGSHMVIEFTLATEVLGRQSYQVRIPFQEGESRGDNNLRAFSFQVVDDRAKVLLVEGEARWEFRYLDAAFSRDTRIDFDHVLFEQPHLQVLPQPFFPRQLPLLPVNPELFKTAGFDQDLIVIGDVSPEHITEDHWQQLLKYVSEGGTLVLSAGHQDFPLGHHSAALNQLLPVNKLIPFQLADQTQAASPRARGLPLQLTVEGQTQPMLQFSTELPENIGIWKGLPGQMWAMLGDAKPGATVWATTTLPAGQVQGLAADRKWGVIVHQYLGSGQVVWLGIDGTWRWRYRVGDQYHHRFWAQLARWAAAHKLSAGNDFVRFGIDQENVEAGQPISVRARWTPPFLAKYPQIKPRAEVFLREGQMDRLVTTVNLLPVEGQVLQHEGRIAALAAGEYQIRLQANQADLGEKPIVTSLLVQDRTSLEMSDLSVNRELLEKIAEASGGRLFLPDEVRNLPGMFRQFEATTVENQEVALWDRWPWLMVLLSLLMGEWVLRKLNGLP